jgi:hypothetical protein
MQLLSGLDDLSPFRLLLNKQDSRPSKLWHRSGKNIIFLQINKTVWSEKYQLLLAQHLKGN